jgi:hypothetical protein
VAAVHSGLSPTPLKKLIKHYAMKAYGGVDYIDPHFLNSELAGGEWSASRPGSFTPGKQSPPRYQFDRKLGGPPEPVWTILRIFLILPGLEIKPLARQARSKSLRYPGSYLGNVALYNCKSSRRFYKHYSFEITLKT